jgi:uncharacterized protein (DUF1810 family)
MTHRANFRPPSASLHLVCGRPTAKAAGARLSSLSAAAVEKPVKSGRTGGNSMNSIEAYEVLHLDRFTAAQESIYDQVLTELRNGHKRSHWMWYIFPQLDGLGHSSTAKRYAIESVEEARRYLEHPVLGARLRECASALLDIEERTATEIFGYPDELKLRSSMTLFACISERDSVFVRVLDKFYQGRQDRKTLDLLKARHGIKGT